MKTDCIFCKIANKEIPSEFVYETENVFVIKDLHPKAKTHLLVIPKKHYPTLNELDDNNLKAELITVIQEVTKKFGISEYQTRIHTGKSAGQEIFHLHIHVLSDKS